jgi:hypothetical protein
MSRIEMMIKQKKLPAHSMNSDNIILSTRNNSLFKWGYLEKNLKGFWIDLLEDMVD